MSLARRTLLAALVAPVAAPAILRPARAALPQAHAVLLFPTPSRLTVPGQHAEGMGEAAGRPLGRFALAAPPLTLPDAPLAVLFDDAQALRPLLNAGRWAFAPPDRALALPPGEAAREVALEGAWLLRLGEGPRPAGGEA